MIYIFMGSFGGPGDLYASGGGFGCGKSSGKATTANTAKATPTEAYKSPGPPKLAIKSYIMLASVASQLFFIFCIFGYPRQIWDLRTRPRGGNFT